MLRKHCLLLSAFVIFSAFSVQAQDVNWSRAPLNKTGNQASGNATATDRAGNSYWVGSFISDTLTFALYNKVTGASYGSANVFVASYDQLGIIRWSACAGGTTAGNDQAYAVCTDTLGDVYVAGSFQSSTIKFGSIVLNRVAGNDIFLAKYSNTGVLRWAKCFGGTGSDEAFGLCADKMNHIYMTGYFNSTSINFGTFNLTNTQSGTSDVFVAKMDTAGNCLWARHAGGTGTDQGKGISADQLGNSYVTGNFTSATAQFGTVSLTNAASSNLFLAKYDANGNVIWAQAPTGPGFANGNGLAADSLGSVYVGGTYGPPSISFGTTTLLDTGTSDAFLARFDSSGVLRWARRVGGKRTEMSGGVAYDGSSNAFLVGSFYSDTLVIGINALVNADTGTADIFLMKYDTAGQLLWAASNRSWYYATAVSQGSDFGYGVSTDWQGNPFITGSFQSTAIEFQQTQPVENYGISNTYLVKVLGPPLGIHEYPGLVNQVVAYPNPASSELTFRLLRNARNPYSLLVCDQVGQTVKRLDGLSSSEFRMQLEGLAPGIYFFKLQEKDGTILGQGKIIFAN